MPRLAAFLVACSALAIAVVAVAPGGAPPAQACSFGPRMLETAVKDASVVVLGDAVSVGGATNSLPRLARLTSTTALIPASATPSPSDSATATGTPPTATLTESPLATATPADLSGIGATFNVVRVYVGDAASPLSVDAGVRASVERAVRLAEIAPWPPPCEPGLGVYRFAAGARYLLLLRNDPRDGLVVTLRFRVEGDAVVVRDPAFPFDGGSLDLTGATYRRYFPGVQAQIDQSETQEFAYVTAPRVPISMVTRAIAALHGGVVLPPATGSAGLASGRP